MHMKIIINPLISFKLQDYHEIFMASQKRALISGGHSPSLGAEVAGCDFSPYFPPSPRYTRKKIWKQYSHPFSPWSFPPWSTMNISFKKKDFAVKWNRSINGLIKNTYLWASTWQLGHLTAAWLQPHVNVCLKAQYLGSQLLPSAPGCWGSLGSMPHVSSLPLCMCVSRIDLKTLKKKKSYSLL